LQWKYVAISFPNGFQTDEMSETRVVYVYLVILGIGGAAVACNPCCDVITKKKERKSPRTDNNTGSNWDRKPWPRLL
jgi:hypothetical protein